MQYYEVVAISTYHSQFDSNWG